MYVIGFGIHLILIFLACLFAMQKNKNDPVTAMVETQSTNKDNNVEK